MTPGRLNLRKDAYNVYDNILLSFLIMFRSEFTELHKEVPPSILPSNLG
jgi:hypothetical protein